MSKKYLHLNMSYIPQLQRHVLALNSKLQALKVLRNSVNGLPNTNEHQATNQMTAIVEMQLDLGKKALVF